MKEELFLAMQIDQTTVALPVKHAGGHSLDKIKNKLKLKECKKKRAF